MIYIARRLILVIAALATAACASSSPSLTEGVADKGIHIYLDSGYKGVVEYELVSNSIGELGVSEGKRVKGRSYVTEMMVDPEAVNGDIRAVVRAQHAGAVDVKLLQDLSYVLSRVKGLSSDEVVSIDEYLEKVPLQYFDLGGGLLRVGPSHSSWKNGILVDVSYGWIFVPPVQDLSMVIAVANKENVAYGYCDIKLSRGDNRRCLYKSYDVSMKSAHIIENFYGYLEDMTFSCDGRVLYVLWKQIDNKHGPIDSIFAIAGHPNSENDYKLTGISIETGEKRTIEIANNLSPGSGDLSRYCDSDESVR